MRLETSALRSFDQGGASKAYLRDMSVFSSDGLSNEPQIPVSVTQTIGASELARVAECRLLEPLRNLLAAENSNRAFRQFDDRIRAALEADPVEDGYTHPAEAYLEKLFHHWGQAAGGWLIGRITDKQWNRSLAADLLRVLSRLKPLTEDWRLRVIELALSSPDIQMRDAGVQAAESWEDSGAVELLKKHSEPCAWLADYIKSVVRDLVR